MLYLPETAEFRLYHSQATTPMGFRWGLDIGQFDIRTLIYRSLRVLTQHCNVTQIHPITNVLSIRQVPFTTAVERPLVCHIIDDISITTVDWSNDSVIAWHKILRQLITASHYPVCQKKSCPVNKFIVNQFHSSSF